MPRPLKWGILVANTIILSKDIDKYAFMCGSNFNETDVKFIGLDILSVWPRIVTVFKAKIYRTLSSKP